MKLNCLVRFFAGFSTGITQVSRPWWQPCMLERIVCLLFQVKRPCSCHCSICSVIYTVIHYSTGCCQVIVSCMLQMLRTVGNVFEIIFILGLTCTSF